MIYAIDHVNQVSAIVIIGSFSAIATKHYTEHYIFTAVSTTEGVHHYEAFPEPEDVCIKSGESNLNMTWTSSKHGYFSIDNNICQLDFRLNGGTRSDNNNSSSNASSNDSTKRESKLACHITFKSINRFPWSFDDPLTAGPEGWLGKSMLLPCHYYIYSTGSDVSYRIELEGPPEYGSIEHSNSGVSGAGEDSLGTSRSERVGSRVLTGQGHMHAEGNYG